VDSLEPPPSITTSAAWSMRGAVTSWGNPMHAAPTKSAVSSWETSTPRLPADAAAWAGVLDGLGRFDESEPLYRRALAVFGRHTGRGITRLRSI